MKRLLLVFIPLVLAAMLSAPAAAQNCGSAPSIYNGASARAYARWCSCMGGTFDANRVACIGAGGGGGSSSNAAAEAAAEAEREREAAAAAERKRQEDELRRQEEERQRREAEERRLQQEQFERNKAQALHDLKGIGGELGLKGDDTGDDFGLKGMGDTGTGGLGLKSAPDSPAAATAVAAAKPTACKWGDQGSSVVDLRCLGLDPAKPITLDWHVVAGKERFFPAQLDPAVFRNANYNNGYAALMRPGSYPRDAEDSIAYFKAALRERLNDPLVRNGLYLAEDILQRRQRRDTGIDQDVYRGFAALAAGNEPAARAAFDDARNRLPYGRPEPSWSHLVQGLEANEQTGNKIACRAVGNALLFESQGNTAAEIAMLKTAVRMYPNDAYLKTMLWRAQHLPTANANPSGAEQSAK